jgi:hypothetical protein
MLRKYEWNMQDIWDTMNRPNLQIKSIEGKEMENKGIDNLLDRIILENFPNLERVIQVQKAYRMSKHQGKKRSTLRHVIIKIFTKQKKESILKAAKRR